MERCSAGPFLGCSEPPAQLPVLGLTPSSGLQAPEGGAHPPSIPARGAPLTEPSCGCALSPRPPAVLFLPAVLFSPPTPTCLDSTSLAKYHFLQDSSSESLALPVTPRTPPAHPRGRFYPKGVQ